MRAGLFNWYVEINLIHVVLVAFLAGALAAIWMLCGQIEDNHETMKVMEAPGGGYSVILWCHCPCESGDYMTVPMWTLEE